MAQKKGKIINWIIFIITLILIFGLLIFMQSKKNPDEIKTPSSVSKDIGKVKLPRKTTSTKELTEKEKSEADNKAFNSAMLGTGNCNSIEFSDRLKQECLDQKAYLKATQTGDETICEKIENKDLRKKCVDQVFLKLAIGSMDEKFCEKIKDKKTKQSCLDNIHASAGRTAKSADECKIIKDFNLKRTCLDNFYLEQSAKKMDKNECEKINDNNMKDRCKRTIEKKVLIAKAVEKQSIRTYVTTEEKLKTCEDMTGVSASQCKNDANFKLAGEKLDLSYCNKIDNTELQQNCIKTQSTSINSLYLRQAIMLGDSSLCQKILDDNLKTNCLSNF